MSLDAARKSARATLLELHFARQEEDVRDDAAIEPGGLKRDGRVVLADPNESQRLLQITVRLERAGRQHRKHPLGYRELGLGCGSGALKCGELRSCCVSVGNPSDGENAITAAPGPLHVEVLLQRDGLAFSGERNQRSIAV